MVRNIAVKKDSEAAEAMVAAEVMAAGVEEVGWAARAEAAASVTVAVAPEAAVTAGLAAAGWAEPCRLCRSNQRRTRTATPCHCTSADRRRAACTREAAKRQATPGGLGMAG